jgi:phage terminase large subunit-like protein
VSAQVEELPDFTRWTPAGQERALDELNRSNLDSWKPFYCPTKQCDGNHHLTVDEGHEPVCETYEGTRPPRLHDWAQNALGVWTCQYVDAVTHERCGATGTPLDQWLFRHARADQHPPSDKDWLIWLLLAGRGAGKTRAGSEWVHRLAAKYPGCHIALISPTRQDVRDTQVEGESGILATARPGMVPEWEPSKMRLTWPNGSTATGYSGEEPDRLRGKQHHFGWVDEPAHIDLIEDVWANFMFGLRLGKKSGIEPKVCLTTSPLPVQWLKDIMAEADTRISRASTYANLANLPEIVRTKILKKWEGTRLGLQEIEGLLLDDVEGALWTTELLEQSRHKIDGGALERIARKALALQMDRINVSIDPAGTSGKRSDETGITVQGILGDEPYVFADESGKYTPEQWAAKAIAAYDYWDADAIVVEITYGREMVMAVLKGYCDRMGRAMPRIITVDSRRGKMIRAEPIVAMWERKQAHIVGELPILETQLTSWVPGKASPDRLDAMVHGITDLARVSSPGSISSPYDLLRRAERATPSGFGLTGVNHGRTPVQAIAAAPPTLRVRTVNPDLLHTTLQSLPIKGSVVVGSYDGETVIVEGSDLRFLAFAIKSQGYGEVVPA